MFFEDHVRKGDRHFQKGNLKKAADHYLKGESYEQAARLYEKLNLVDEAVDAYGEARLFVEAGDLLEREDRPRDAVTYFERGHNYRRAAETCERLGASARAGELFERAEMFDRAARSYAEARQLENALRALGKERERLREEQFDETLLTARHDQRLRQLDLQRVELLVRLDRQDEAAQLLLEANMPERAAGIFEKAGDLAGAAEAYVALSRPEAALRALEKAVERDGAGAVEPELRARVYGANGRHYEAGEILEEMGRAEDAARAFEEGGALVRAAKLWQEHEEPSLAADLYWRAQRFRRAGEQYASAGHALKAGEAFARAAVTESSDDEARTLHEQSAAAYVAAERDFDAGREYLLAGQPRDAIRVLQDVGEDDPDHDRANFLMVLALVESGLLSGARDRLGALKSSSRSSGGDLSRADLLYAEGRILEAEGETEKARRNYELVISEQFDYRDAGRRLSAIDHEEREAAKRAQGKKTESRKPTGQAKERRVATGSRPTTPAVGESGSFELPVKVLDRLEERWWDGAEFLKAVDPETGDPKLLVSFPLAQVGERVDGFRVAMRTVGGVRHQAVLRLEDTLIASDKVILVYEAFDGVPLASVLRQGHVFEPLDALRLVLQLDEALINAHKLGVTHQWLSPRTVLVGRGADQRCKLVGLGLREFLSFGDDDESMQYVAPEVLDDGVVGPAADAFSSGRLAMDLFGARLPRGWRAGDEIDADAVGWPQATRDSIPSSSLGFLCRTLQPEALRRPSVQELTVALSAAGLLEGQLLAERYEVRGELGRGGMSRVYRARDTLLDDEVAIKTVITPALGRSDDEERLLREVQISRRISHDNVVRVHDLGRFPGGIFVIMEILEGPGLDEVIAADAPMELERVRRIAGEIARALGAAHKLQIVHRDLKPGNVILVRDEDEVEKAKVLDFGIARMNDGSSSHLTRTGEVIGSPLYMSPEQIQGLPLEGTCDLYALGVILYAMLTGGEPFHADTPTAVIFQHLNEPPPDVRQRREDLPEEWAELLERLLAKKPQDRYPNADELNEALEKLPV